MDTQDFLKNLFLPDMRMAAPGYTPKQKKIVKERRKIEVESESESEPEPEPEPAGINVIDDRSFIILNSYDECKWVRLTDGNPIDDQTPLKYFGHWETWATGTANWFQELDYFLGVLDEEGPTLRRWKALYYKSCLRKKFFKQWPEEAIKTFIKQQSAFKLAVTVLWEKMRDGELEPMRGTFNWLFFGIRWLENRARIELERGLNSLDPENLRKFLFNFDLDQRVQTLEYKFKWPRMAALVFSYTIENMELPEIKNMFDNHWEEDGDLTDLSEVLQKIRSTL